MRARLAIAPKLDVPALAIVRVRATGREHTVPVTLRVPEDFFAKAEAAGRLENTGTGERWITVHPNGKDEKGVPVLIRQSATHHGTWQVIGGAGGKLNYLRLTGVKSPEEYKQQAHERRKAKKEVDARQQELTKQKRAAMTPAELEAEKEREKHKADQQRMREESARNRERKIIADVAQHVGWDPNEWQFDATAERLKKAGASEERIQKLEATHHKRMLRRAEAVLEASKKHLLATRARELGEMPFEAADEEKPGLADVLEQPSLQKGKGFQAITRTSSDAKIKHALAGADVVALAREESVLAEEVAAGAGPDASSKLKEVRAELRAAQLMREGATLTPDAIKQRRNEVAAAKSAAMETFTDLRKQLHALPEGDARRTDVADKLLTTQRQLKNLAERAVDVELLAGTTVQPAVTGEKQAVQARRQAEREAQIRAEGGDVERYRFMLSMLEDAREKYQAEMKHYRETGALRQPTAPVKPITSAETALQLLGQQKALKKLKGAKETKEFDERIFGKGYFSETGEASPAMVAEAERDLVSKLNEKRTRAFLSKLESPELLVGGGAESAFTEQRGPRELGAALERHMGAGSYNVLNNVALAALHMPVLSREAADVLGAAGAAQVLAHALRQGGESPTALREMAQGLAEYHLEHNVAQAEERVREAEEMLAHASEAVLRLTNPEDVGLAMEANRERDRLLESARQTLGQALGEYEATAALVQALGQSSPKDISVTLGPIGAEASIRQLRAIGLQKADYEVHSDGTNYFATIKPSGYDRLLTEKPDPERQKLTEEMLAIKRGDRDEADYVPPGSIVRPSSTFSERGLEPEPLTHGLRAWNEYGQDGDAGEQLEETIARRAANGEPLNEVLADVSANLGAVPAAAKPAMQKVLAETFPTKTPALENGRPVLNADGTPRLRKMTASEHRANVEKLIGKHFERLGIPVNTALHAQELDVAHPHTAEALTRALAADPRAMVAFHPIGELTKQDQKALRHYFLTEIAKPTAAQGFDEKAVHGKLAELGPEPQKESPSLFGGTEANPAWLDWKRARDAIMADAHGDAAAPTTTTWDDYTTAMGGRAQAYAALQDQLKSKFVRDFHTHYTTLHGKPLRVGLQAMQHGTRHAAFLDPELREKTLTERRAEIEAARNRSGGGQYAVGAVLPKLDRLEQHKQYERENQLGLGILGATANATTRGEPLAHERYTLGSRAEGQLASLLPGIARNFRPDQPVAMLKDRKFHGNKVGLLAQRGIKAIETGKRLALGFGAGTGKTGIFQSAFASLRSKPETGVKRGIFLAPSSVQEQFGPEFARFVKPGVLNWAANPDSDREARYREHTDPETHAVVHTHQSFRDDMLHLLGKKWGTDRTGTTERFMKLDRKQAAATMKEVMGDHGIDYQYMVVDEGHGLLDRAGKPDSILSRVMQGVSDNMPYYVAASADPVKNDVTEVRSQLDRLHPDGRYSDAGAWQRRYGVNTTAAAEAMKREIAPSIYAESLPGLNQVTRTRTMVSLHPEQQKAVAAVQEAVAKLRVARANGTADVAAAKVLAPEAFKKLPVEQHEALAKKLAANPGTWAEHAQRRAIDLAPAHQNAKIQRLVEDLKTHNPKDKPAVVFAHNLKAVDELKEALAAEGHRVTTLTGGDTKSDRAKNRKKFQPPPGREAEADVFILSDAGSTGLNLQRGQRLYQYDRPMTAMTHAQRDARIDRLGQKNPVELVDLTTDSDYEARAQRRIDTKYELRNIMTDAAADIDDTGVAKVIKEARQRAVRLPQEVAA